MSVVRLIAAVLLVCLLAQDAFAFAPQRPPAPAAAMPLVRFTLPASEAAVDDGFTPAAEAARPPRVILFQDAHTNASGQFNLAAALERVVRAEGVRRVYVEGGWGDCSLTGLKRASDPDRLRTAAERSVRSGVLHGEEYLALTSDLDLEIVGAENEAAYRKGLEAYASAADARDEALRYLDRMRRGLNDQGAFVLNPELAKFQAARERYHGGGAAFAEWFGALLGQARRTGVYLGTYPHLKLARRVSSMERSLDPKRIEREERAAVRTLSDADRSAIEAARPAPAAGRAQADDTAAVRSWYFLLEEKLGRETRAYPALNRYLRYLRELREVSAPAVLKELDALEAETLERLTPDLSEKILIRLKDSAVLLEKLVRLRITPDEYDRLKRLQGFADAEHLSGFVNALILERGSGYEGAILLKKSLERAETAAKRFYAAAAERDALFLDSVQRHLDGGLPGPAVLITGGFHTEALKDRLRQKGISFVSILPAVTEETDTDRYERLLLAQRAFLSPEKSAVSGPASAARPAMEPSSATHRMVPLALNPAELARLAGASVPAGLPAAARMPAAPERIRTAVTPDESYDVVMTRGVFDPANPLLADEVRGRKAFFVIDRGMGAENIGRFKEYILAKGLADPDFSNVLYVSGGERLKNGLRGLLRVIWINYRAWKAGLDRKSVFVLAGGGATLDMAGFAASVFHRGADHVRIPTTLLAQDDAGIGVKNGINLFGQKNFFGVFQPPQSVIVDPYLLKHAPRTLMSAGLAEIIKVTLMKDEAGFRLLEKDHGALLDLPAALRGELGLTADELGSLVERAEALIAVSIRDHLGQIGTDPFEKKLARPLDYGHQWAHRLEVLTRHWLSHGQAVAIGTAIDSHISWKRGYITGGEFKRILALIRSSGLPVFDRAAETEALWQGMEDFRKHLGGELTISLLGGPGAPFDTPGIGKKQDVHDIRREELEDALRYLGRPQASSGARMSDPSAPDDWPENIQLMNPDDPDLQNALFLILTLRPEVLRQIREAEDFKFMIGYLPEERIRRLMASQGAPEGDVRGGFMFIGMPNKVVFLVVPTEARVHPVNTLKVLSHRLIGDDILDKLPQIRETMGQAVGSPVRAVIRRTPQEMSDRLLDFYRETLDVHRRLSPEPGSDEEEHVREMIRGLEMVIRDTAGARMGVWGRVWSLLTPGSWVLAMWSLVHAAAVQAAPPVPNSREKAAAEDRPEDVRAVIGLVDRALDPSKPVLLAGDHLDPNGAARLRTALRAVAETIPGVALTPAKDHREWLRRPGNAGLFRDLVMYLLISSSAEGYRTGADETVFPYNEDAFLAILNNIGHPGADRWWGVLAEDVETTLRDLLDRKKLEGTAGMNRAVGLADLVSAGLEPDPMELFAAMREDRPVARMKLPDAWRSRILANPLLLAKLHLFYHFTQPSGAHALLRSDPAKASAMSGLSFLAALEIYERPVRGYWVGDLLTQPAQLNAELSYADFERFRTIAEGTWTLATRSKPAALPALRAVDPAAEAVVKNAAERLRRASVPLQQLDLAAEGYRRIRVLDASDRASLEKLTPMALKRLAADWSELERAVEAMRAVEALRAAAHPLNGDAGVVDRAYEGIRTEKRRVLKNLPADVVRKSWPSGARMANGRHLQVLESIVTELHRINEMADWLPAVTVFGSARIPPQNPFYRLAYELGQEMGRMGIPGRTGAGPSIMEAVLMGILSVAPDRPELRQGIRILLPFEQETNPMVGKILLFDHFLTRKRALDEDVIATVALPGGIGSMDEFFEAMRRGRPLALLGESFWWPAWDAFFAAWKRAGIVEPMMDGRRSRPFITDRVSSVMDFIRNSRHVAEHHQHFVTPPERMDLLVAELRSSYLQLHGWPESVTVIGHPAPDSPLLIEAERLASRLWSSNVPVRIASENGLDRRLWERAQADGMEDLFQSVIFKSDRTGPIRLGLTSQIPDTRRIVIRDESLHQFLTAAHSSAFVFLPGGFGTMNRLFDIVQLMQVKKVDHQPIVLLGRDYWQPLLDTLRKIWLEHEGIPNMVNPEDMDIFRVADNAEEAEEALLRPISAARMARPKDADEVEYALKVLFALLTKPKLHKLGAGQEGVRAKHYADLLRMERPNKRIYDAFKYLWSNGFLDRPVPANGPYFFTGFSAGLKTDLDPEAGPESMPRAIMASLGRGLRADADHKQTIRTIGQIQYWARRFPDSDPFTPADLDQKLTQALQARIAQAESKAAGLPLEARFKLVREAVELIEKYSHLPLDADLVARIRVIEEAAFNELAEHKLEEALAEKDPKKSVEALIAAKRFARTQTAVKPLVRFRVVDRADQEIQTRILRMFPSADARIRSDGEVAWLMAVRGYPELKETWGRYQGMKEKVRRRSFDLTDLEARKYQDREPKWWQAFLAAGLCVLAFSQGWIAFPVISFTFAVIFAFRSTDTIRGSIITASVLTALFGVIEPYVGWWFLGVLIYAHEAIEEVLIWIMSRLSGSGRPNYPVRKSELPVVTAMLLRYRDFRASFETWESTRRTVAALREVGINELWDNPSYRFLYHSHDDGLSRKDVPTHLEMIRRAVRQDFLGHRDESGRRVDGAYAGSLIKGGKSVHEILARYPDVLKALREDTITLDQSLFLLTEIRQHFVKPGSEGAKVLDEYIHALASNHGRLGGMVEAGIWARDPWTDLSRQSEFFCCAFLNGLYEDSVYGYITSKAVTMIDLSDKGGRKVRVIAAAGIYERAEGGMAGVLLVDSVEGTLSVDPEIIRQAIEEYAYRAGFKAVMYNAKTYNATPQQFVRHLRQNGVDERSVHIRLADEEAKLYLEAMPRTSGSRHLKESEGVIEGLWVRLETQLDRFEAIDVAAAVYEPAGKGDWPRIRGQVMEVEQTFAESIRESEDALRRRFTGKDSINWTVSVKGRIVGYATGGPLEDYSSVKGVKKDPEHGNRSTFYLASLAVRPGIPRSVRKKLRAEIVRAAAGAGYRHMSAHEPREMVAELERPQVVSRHANWYGTGADYYYVRLTLGTPETAAAPAPAPVPAPDAPADAAEKEVRVRELGPEAWAEAGPTIVRLEKSFDVRIRQSAVSLKETFEDEKGVRVVAEIDGKIVGYVMGRPLERYEDLEGPDRDEHRGQGDTLYSESMVVQKELRGRGIATLLQKQLDESARGAGFRYKTAHRREGVAAKVGAQVLARYPDWSGTGQTYEYSRADLFAAADESAGARMADLEYSDGRRTRRNPDRFVVTPHDAAAFSEDGSWLALAGGGALSVRVLGTAWIPQAEWPADAAAGPASDLYFAEGALWVRDASGKRWVWKNYDTGGPLVRLRSNQRMPARPEPPVSRKIGVEIIEDGRAVRVTPDLKKDLNVVIRPEAPVRRAELVRAGDKDWNVWLDLENGGVQVWDVKKLAQGPASLGTAYTEASGAGRGRSSGMRLDLPIPQPARTARVFLPDEAPERAHDEGLAEDVMRALSDPEIRTLVTKLELGILRHYIADPVFPDSTRDVLADYLARKEGEVDFPATRLTAMQHDRLLDRVQERHAAAMPGWIRRVLDTAPKKQFLELDYQGRTLPAEAYPFTVTAPDLLDRLRASLDELVSGARLAEDRSGRLDEFARRASEAIGVPAGRSVTFALWSGYGSVAYARTTASGARAARITLAEPKADVFDPEAAAAMLDGIPDVPADLELPAWKELFGEDTRLSDDGIEAQVEFLIEQAAYFARLRPGTRFFFQEDLSRFRPAVQEMVRAAVRREPSVFVMGAAPRDKGRLTVRMTTLPLAEEGIVNLAVEPLDRGGEMPGWAAIFAIPVLAAAAAIGNPSALEDPQAAFSAAKGFVDRASVERIARFYGPDAFAGGIAGPEFLTALQGKRPFLAHQRPVYVMVRATRLLQEIRAAIQRVRVMA